MSQLALLHSPGEMEGRGFPEEGIGCFQPGHYLGFFNTPCRGFSVLDVERPHLPASVPLLWTCKSHSGVLIHRLGVIRLWLLVPLNTTVLNRLPPLQFWQLFNALTLFNLARDPECKEWQVSQGSGRDAWEIPSRLRLS